VIHSQMEPRYRCKNCAKMLSKTRTARYRLNRPHELMSPVATLMAYGCPMQAIVAAFSVDERTVARWQREGRRQFRRVHERLVQAGGYPYRRRRFVACLGDLSC
jgi:transposase-like protein